MAGGKKRRMSKAERCIVIVGGGGHAASVAGVAMACGVVLIGFVDPARAGETVFGIPVFSDTDRFMPAEADFAIAIGNNYLRERVAEELEARIGPARFAKIAHPSAVIGEGASIGPGTVVMPNATIGPLAEVGRHCIVNTNASVDHETVMSDFSSVAPGVHTGGCVKIGARSAIGIGAAVKHGVVLGADVVIGASSYVDKDIPDRTVAYGIPARIIRRREIDEGYL